MTNQETYDISDVPSGNFIDEPGEYDVAIVEAQDHIFKSGSTGYMIKMRDENGRTIIDRIVVNTKTLWKTKQIAEAAGITPEEQKRFHHNLLVGKTVKIFTDLDDENYNKVVRYAKTDVEIDLPAAAQDEAPF